MEHRFKLQLDSCLAALSMYTRLPAWRLKDLSAESYSLAINALPLVGLITGGLMATVFCLAFHVMQLSFYISIILAILARLLLTGAFHEDGLGDFFDGFGGGRDKESILRIMKDSHVGSYAVIGYIIYYLLLTALLTAIHPMIIPLVLLVSDVVGKLSVLLLVNTLPYARTTEESKIKLVYTTRVWHVAPLIALIVLLLVGQYLLGWSVLLLLLNALVWSVLFVGYVRYKIGAYTGDTCGAMTLFIEIITIFFIYLESKG